MQLNAFLTGEKSKWSMEFIRELHLSGALSCFVRAGAWFSRAKEESAALGTKACRYFASRFSYVAI